MESGRRRYLGGMWLFFLVGWVGWVGCDRNIAAYDPTEKSAAPDLRQIFPAPERTEAPMQAAMGARPTEVADLGSSGSVVRGEIDLDEGVTPEPGSVLFVIARKRGLSGGPPLAVMRIGNPEFPQSFELGPEQVMIPTLRFEGPVSISARLDRDGNAMTREPSDPATVSVVEAMPGDEGVELLLQVSAPSS